MKSFQRGIVVIAIAAAAWAGDAALSNAQMMGGHGKSGGDSPRQESSGMMGSGMMKMMGSSMGKMCGNPLTQLLDLGLSDKQIGKYIDLHAQLMKGQVPALRERMRLEKELADLRAADNPNTDKLRATIEELGKVKADLEVRKVEARKAALKILTDEQKEKLGNQPLPMFDKSMKNCGKMMQSGMMEGKSPCGKMMKKMMGGASSGS